MARCIIPRTPHESSWEFGTEVIPPAHHLGPKVQLIGIRRRRGWSQLFGVLESNVPLRGDELGISWFFIQCILQSV